MTVSQNPILRQADADKNEYRGFAMAQMRILKDYMKLAKLNTYSRIVQLANGVVITCEVCFNREDVFIDMPDGAAPQYTETIESVSGIIFHPRSGVIGNTPYTKTTYIPLVGNVTESVSKDGVAGGWESGDTVLATKYAYPLVDTDKASFVVGELRTDTIDGNHTIISTDQDFSYSGFPQPGQYGNLYWENGAIWDNETKSYDKPFVCLSWKGTPTRHFRLPESINILGFSELSGYIPRTTEDTPEYTAFGKYIYRGGEAVSKAPRYSWPYAGSEETTGITSLILGVMQDATGVSYIVTQNDHRQAPKFVWGYSDGYSRSGDTETYLAEVNNKGNPPVTIVIERPLVKTGFYLGLWQSKTKPDHLTVDGWTLITEIPYTRNGLPWFGNTLGTQFVCSNGDKLTALGLFTPYVSVAVGTAKETADWQNDTGHYWFDTRYEMRLTGGETYFEYTINDLVNSNYAVSALMTSSATFSNKIEIDETMGKMYTTQYPTNINIAGGNGAAGGTVFVGMTFYLIIGGGSLSGCCYTTTWSCPFGYEKLGENAIVITSVDGVCGPQDISVAFSFPYANYPVTVHERAPNGQWTFSNRVGSDYTGYVNIYDGYKDGILYKIAIAAIQLSDPTTICNFSNEWFPLSYTLAAASSVGGCGDASWFTLAGVDPWQTTVASFVMYVDVYTWTCP